MKPAVHLVLPAAVVAAAAVAALAGCGGEGNTPPATTAASRAATVAVTIRHGRVEGGIRRAEVKKGSEVVLRVDADVADEVHVHGYDLKRDVAPGMPARLAFRATLTGSFEVELEQRSLQIAELQVRP